jgi:hypothetical protein
MGGGVVSVIPLAFLMPRALLDFFEALIDATCTWGNET